MTILVSHQAVPPHFTTKLRPWSPSVIGAMKITGTFWCWPQRDLRHLENSYYCVVGAVMYLKLRLSRRNCVCAFDRNCRTVKSNLDRLERTGVLFTAVYGLWMRRIIQLFVKSRGLGWKQLREECRHNGADWLNPENYSHPLHSVPNEAFRGPEAQLFEGPHLFSKKHVSLCPHNTRVHHAK